MKIAQIGFIAFVVLAAAACSPKVYLIDRQTVLEDEAAGEWPQFETGLLDASEASSPTEFPKTAENSRKSRLYNVLNDEVAAQRK